MLHAFHPGKCLRNCTHPNLTFPRFSHDVKQLVERIISGNNSAENKPTPIRIDENEARKIAEKILDFNRVVEFVPQVEVADKQDPNKKDPNFPEPPTTCCMSGCANCVWLEYAEKISQYCKDGGEKAVAEIEKNITDEFIKAYVLFELRMRQSEKDKDKKPK